ncbi:peroxisomal membrane protein PMP34-like [Lineus longissimus]|uniref:peroxisomal membrane protein PMP34-like n=1 Tax=Lineus longissimus TaxID=88925 RepID=UPI002B4F7102
MPYDLEKLFGYPVLVHAVAGAVGMATSMIVFYPLDTARTRLQIDDQRKAKSTPAVIAEIFKEERFLGLYRGVFPLLTTITTSYFVYFYVYNGLKAVAFYDNSKPGAISDLGIAFIAACINVLATNPLWVVYTRLKMQGAKFKTKELEKKKMPLYTGILDALQKVWKLEGWSGLWSGTLPSLILAANPAIQFMVYEALKRYMQGFTRQAELNGAVYFSIGAVAKVVATLATYPLQLVQSRVRSGYNEKSSASLRMVLVGLLRKNGILGLFKGLEAKLLQTVLTAALMFLCYEKIAAFIFKIMGQPQLIGKR